MSRKKWRKEERMEYWNKMIDARSSLLNEILYFSCIERKKVESKRKDINFSDSNLIRARKHFISCVCIRVERGARLHGR